MVNVKNCLVYKLVGIDELFQQLKVWNDFNQDAKVQEGELQSLKDARVTSIDLNYVSISIEINIEREVA
jgi:diketogulonate reductase-like aldo/keto reductase